MDNNDTRLFAMYVEAFQGQKRVQWMIYPPALGEHGAALPEGTGRFMKRRLDREGHRAKWKTTDRSTMSVLNNKLALEFDQYESTEWVFRAPIVIAIEEDDYAKAMGKELSTPYKALRHVNKVAVSRGYSVS